ncbi:hypothetical protein GNY06_01675 [Elizabethkingia argentiflava]|uniref:Uncharacterized protein n=1 Tax=Elizabethkingia argenteiflava TaxID=2681556 RepID=A0A845PV31_9FLAO|nr:hypothetical protein [Elizabethkingia argenteiflava]NAW50148.1 hypothetical protein [Elizabethkingia argenteiflava]
MKKLLLGLLVISSLLQSCRKDDYNDQYMAPNVDQNTQNHYDDTAIKEYLDEHYFDERGKIRSFDDAHKPSDKTPKLSSMAKTLPSGVIYVIRPNAQPEKGTQVKDKDVLKFMQVGFAARAIKPNKKIEFTAALPFYNTVDLGGVAVEDPQWYYVKKSVLAAAKNDVAKKRSYYEIEGFQEAIKQFKAFTLKTEDNYNLQGLIIVPSRAAFAKDPHYPYLEQTSTGIYRSLNDYTFFFNFQLYSAKPRSLEEE